MVTIAPAMIILVGAVLGSVLGLLGGGGGILAVPLLIALGEPVAVAATTSLVVVISGSVAALVLHHQAGRVDWRIGLSFGALGTVGAVVGARAGLVVSPLVSLLGLAVLLAFGASAMLRSAARGRSAAAGSSPSPSKAPGASADPADPPRAAGAGAQPTTAASVAVGGGRAWLKVVLLATGVGLITGFFGVGGGFIVVPALVAALSIPVHRATATGLVVIVVNSSVALITRHENIAPAGLTVGLAATTAVFAVLGAAVSRRIPGWVLSSAFGFLTVGVAIYTLVKAATLA